MGALAEYERAKLLERSKRGLIGSAKAGHVNGGRGPLGYRYVSAPHQGRLEIDAAEAEVVRQILQWYVEGLTIRCIALRLTEARIPTATDRRGYTTAAGRKPCKQEACGVWSAGSVAVILKNPVYMGQMRYNARANVRRHDNVLVQRWRPVEEWLTVPVPATIDPETFAAVQRRRQENRHLHPQSHATALLGGRWFRCGRCGLAMSNLHVKHLHYYRCSSWHTRMAPERRCRGTVRADMVESQVWEAVMRLLEQPELVADAVATQQATMHAQEAGIDEELGAVERALARCDEEDRRLVEAYVAGAFTAAELKAYRADAAARRQSLEGHQQDLFGRRAALQQTMGQTTALVEYCARVREQLQTFSQEEQQRALDALALRVIWAPKQPLHIQASLFVEVSTSPWVCSSPNLGGRNDVRVYGLDLRG